MTHHRRVALVSAAAATLALTATAVPASAGASTSPAAPAASSQTDGLLGLPIALPTIPIVSTVVSTLPIVGGGTAPTTLPTLPGLEPLTGILATLPIIGGSDPTTALAGLPALPIVSTLLPGGTSPLAALSSALEPLTGLAAGLPTGGLPAGTVPTGAALKPVTDLLRQIAGLTSATPLAGALTSLADQIDALGDAGASTDLLSVLSSTLGSLAQTPGVPTDVQTAVGTLATQLAPKPVATTSTPVTTTTPVKTVTTTTTPVKTTTTTTTTAPVGKAAVGSAKLTSVSVDRKLGKLRFVLSCPATGPACKTFVGAYRGTRLSGNSALLSIPAGTSVTKTLKLDAATRRLIKRKTTKFTVAALLPGGAVSKRNVTAKLPKVAKKKTAVKKTAKR